MAAMCTAEAKGGEGHGAGDESTGYEAAATVLAEADYILFAGGAGLSAECGLKTFANAGTFADGLSYDQVGREGGGEVGRWGGREVRTVRCESSCGLACGSCMSLAARGPLVLSGVMPCQPACCMAWHGI